MPVNRALSNGVCKYPGMGEKKGGVWHRLEMGGY